MKKKLFSLALVLMLIIAMSIPAFASTISASYTWNGVYYATNDQCNSTSFNCIMESDSTTHYLSVDVAYYAHGTEEGTNDDVNVYMGTYEGNQSLMYATNRGTFPYALSYIYCYHKVNGTVASTQKVWGR